MGWFDSASSEEGARAENVQQRFPCQQCGAQLDFTPGTNHLTCQYCNHQHTITESADNREDGIREFDFHSTLQNLPDADAKGVSMSVKCEACAAEFQFDKNIHSDECPFCGTQIVVDSQAHRHIQPSALLPFKITSEQASNSYKRWLKRLWFAPSKLKKYARKDSTLNGMYIPYWTYDCRTRSQYTGERGTLYQERQRVRVKVNGRWQMQTRMVTKIRWQPARGRIGREFDDVLVFAGESIPRNVARELSPWDLENLEPYNEKYLSSFRSELYHTDLDDGFNIARDRIHPVIRSDIRSDIGGDHQRIHDVQTQYSEVSFKHILMPFWIAGFRFRNKPYRFIVNGRTGEVQGDRPYSYFKIAMAVLFGIAVAVIALGALSQGDFNSGYSTGFDIPQIQWPQTF